MFVRSVSIVFDSILLITLAVESTVLVSIKPILGIISVMYSNSVLGIALLFIKKMFIHINLFFLFSYLYFLLWYVYSQSLFSYLFYFYKHKIPNNNNNSILISTFSSQDAGVVFSAYSCLFNSFIFKFRKFFWPSLLFFLRFFVVLGIYR